MKEEKKSRQRLLKRRPIRGFLSDRSTLIIEKPLLGSKNPLVKEETDTEGYINSRYEKDREKKVAEWRAKGYPEALIEKTLKWADEWSKGMARRFVKDPVMRATVEESIYPEALNLSERFIEAMANKKRGEAYSAILAA